MGKNDLPQGIKTVLFWTIGIGIIALTGLILLILFGNLAGNTGFGQVASTFSNNTVTLDDTAVNVTTPGVNPTLENIIVTNATGGEVVPASNYTIVGGTIKTNISSAFYNGTEVNVSGTQNADEQGKIDTDNLIFNYSESVTNTSAQFPVVGTIIGVALLLIILIGVLIFAVAKLLNMTGSTGSSKGTSSSGFDRGGFG